MAHGLATEVLLDDLSYEGENVALRQLRQKAALKILQSTGIVPKEGGGDMYLMQQNNIMDPELMAVLSKALGLKGDLAIAENRAIGD